MMKHYFIILVTLFNLFIINYSSAQSIKSIYSIFGVGQLADNSYGINRSLGGTGIAFQSGRSINFQNPASYLGIQTNSLNMELGIYGNYTFSKDEHTTQTDADMNINYFATNYYLSNWWASSFGIIPFSNVNYEINSSDDLVGEPVSYDKKYIGTGGLNQIYLGNSFRLMNGLSIGFNLSLIYGNISQSEFGVSNEGFTGYELVNHRRAYAFYLDYGLQYSFNKNDNNYTVGVIYGMHRNLHTTDKIEFIFEDSTTSLEQENKSTISIPQKFGIGLAYRNNNKFKAGFDYTWKNWANTNFTNSNFELKNSHRYSMGIEYIPIQRNSKYKNLVYRFGTFYQSSHIKINDSGINNNGINLGIGIPYGENGLFNLSLEYSTQGTKNNGLIEDKILGFYINFSLRELLNINADQ